MFDYYIYTLGDPEFLHGVFLSVASLFYGGVADDYLDLLKIAMLVGVIIAVIRPLMNPGQGINPGYFLVVIIFYTAFVGNRVDVTIEDVYSGDVYVAPDVPLGIAFIGSVTSQIGYGVTKWFDQAFSYPNSGSAFSEGGHVNALNVLMKLRTSTTNPLNIEGSSKLGGADFVTSWNNYIQDCTLVGVDLGLTDPNSIITDGDSLAGLRFESNVFVTSINVGAGFVTDTCAGAHTTLTLDTRNIWMDNLLDELRAQVLPGRSLAASVPSDSENAIQDSLNYIGQTLVTAKEYMIANVLVPTYQQALVGKYENDHQFNAALGIAQAIEQRNVKWAAEQSLFVQSFRPMYTFIEGMIYAITPLMVVLIMLGPFGAALVGKQFMALIWIQLWMPLMCIANMYIYIQVNNAFDASTTLAYPIPSIGAIMSVDNTIQTYIALGGYMAASAPILAAFVISGSAVALQGVASRMQQTTDFDPKMVSPDITAPAPVIANDSTYSSDKHGGTTFKGVSERYAGVGNSFNLSQAQSSSQQAAKSAALNFTSMLKQGAGRTIAKNDGVDKMASLGNQIRSGLNENNSAVLKSAQQFSSNWNTGSANSQILQNMFLASVSGQFNPGSAEFNQIARASLGFGASGNLSETEQKQLEDRKSQMSQELIAASTDETLQQTFGQEMAQSYVENGKISFMDTAETHSTADQSKLAQETVNSQKAYSEISSSQASMMFQRMRDPVRHFQEEAYKGKAGDYNSIMMGSANWDKMQSTFDAELNFARQAFPGQEHAATIAAVTNTMALHGEADRLIGLITGDQSLQQYYSQSDKNSSLAGTAPGVDIAQDGSITKEVTNTLNDANTADTVAGAEVAANTATQAISGSEVVATAAEGSSNLTDMPVNPVVADHRQDSTLAVLNESDRQAAAPARKSITAAEEMIRKADNTVSAGSTWNEFIDYQMDTVTDVTSGIATGFSVAVDQIKDKGYSFFTGEDHQSSPYSNIYTEPLSESAVNIAQEAGLNEIEQQIFARSTSESWEMKRVQNNTDFESDSKAAARADYHRWHQQNAAQNGLSSDADLVDQKFDMIWNAAEGGDYRGTLLQPIGELNRASQEYSRQYDSVGSEVNTLNSDSPLPGNLREGELSERGYSVAPSPVGTNSSFKASGSDPATTISYNSRGDGNSAPVVSTSPASESNPVVDGGRSSNNSAPVSPSVVINTSGGPQSVTPSTSGPGVNVGNASESHVPFSQDVSTYHGVESFVSDLAAYEQEIISEVGPRNQQNASSFVDYDRRVEQARAAYTDVQSAHYRREASNAQHYSNTGDYRDSSGVRYNMNHEGRVHSEASEVERRTELYNKMMDTHSGRFDEVYNSAREQAYYGSKYSVGAAREQLNRDRSSLSADEYQQRSTQISSQEARVDASYRQFLTETSAGDAAQNANRGFTGLANDYLRGNFSHSSYSVDGTDYSVPHADEQSERAQLAKQIIQSGYGNSAFVGSGTDAGEPSYDPYEAPAGNTVFYNGPKQYAN